MSESVTSFSEITTWLEKVLTNKNFTNLKFELVGNSEKGDGYIGDIAFVEVSGTTKNNTIQKINLVLKCSKTSQALREKAPVREAFLNEIHFYNVVFPTFMQFQKDRKNVEPFQKIAKCYGTLSTGEKEFIALENLRSKGYFLWDKTKPLTRQHIDMVIEEYGKYHGVSIAMQDQEPEKFQQLTKNFYDVLEKFEQLTPTITVYENKVVEISETLKNDFTEEFLKKWLNLKPKLRPLWEKSFGSLEGLKVITHGDCWNNNFMFYNIDGKPTTFAMLDFQLSKYSSPLFDLSYFLFCTISEEDIGDLDTILRNYYRSLNNQVKNLGSSLDTIYPFDLFLEDWKKYAKYGLSLSTVLLNICLSENDEVPDMAAAAEKGEEIAETFGKPVRNQEAYKNRFKYIVKYVVENDLI